MKNFLPKIFAGAALIASTSAHAQLADGSTAPDFTLTDIDGVSHNLYTYLSAGKTVFIDFSAAWCGPCWNYHNTHALRDLYEKHGPTGTCSDDVIVLFIEGESTNTLAQITGTSTGSTYATYTQGNWTTGTPYPIIDAGASSVTNDYDIIYFPTIYKICPDKKVYEVGQATTPALEASVASCGFAVDGHITAGPTPLQCNTTFAPTFTFKNTGTTTITSATFTYDVDGGTAATHPFTGSLAAGATTTVTLPSVTATGGAHTLNINITDVNGATDDNRVNNCHSYSFNISSGSSTTAPLAENFATTSFPYADWIVDNPDGGITWARVSTSGGALKMDHYNYGTAGQKDAFYVKPLDITGITTPGLHFDVAYVPYNASLYEALNVYVSSDCGLSWTNVYSKSGTTLATAAAQTSAFTPSASQWRTEHVNLNAFSTANRLYIKFESTNGYGNNMYIDNINVLNVTSVTERPEASFNVNVYPNPVNDMATVNVDLSKASDIEVYVTNTMGQILFTQKGAGNVGSNNIAIDFSAYSSGLYFVNVKADNQVVTSKITK